MRKFLATLAFGGLLAFGAPGAAEAQQQDGLVNVNVGDVTILRNVNVGLAAQVAANICGVRVGPVAVLGRAVDRSGETETVCTADQNMLAEDITIRQN